MFISIVLRLIRLNVSASLLAILLALLCVLGAIYGMGTFSVAQADTLKVFKSDGCSGFPNGTFKQAQLWLTCCQRHDYDYWQGGTYQQRLTSDKALQMCVAQVGEPHIAKLMLAGVRVGGSPYFPTRFRWGYGWDYPRLYRALTESEQLQVRQQSQLIKWRKNKIKRDVK